MSGTAFIFWIIAAYVGAFDLLIGMLRLIFS